MLRAQRGCAMRPGWKTPGRARTGRKPVRSPSALTLSLASQTKASSRPGEAPRLAEIDRLIEVGAGGPQEEQAVVRRDGGDRKALELGQRERLVMADGAAGIVRSRTGVLELALVVPRRIGIDDAITAGRQGGVQGSGRTLALFVASAVHLEERARCGLVRQMECPAPCQASPLAESASMASTGQSAWRAQRRAAPGWDAWGAEAESLTRPSALH